MRITVAFKVRNYVEVMEGWPIEVDGVSFFLEMENDRVTAVCACFTSVPISTAPTITPLTHGKIKAHIQVPNNDKIPEAISKILKWQTVVSGIQIFDIDFDDYEVRFSAENESEEDSIDIKSFSSPQLKAFNTECDFEQIGRAFCVDGISDRRIESTSHFRDGRLAFEAGRFIDSYNCMYLFLETRYCEGKTGTAQQVAKLSASDVFCESLAEAISEAPMETKECTKISTICDPNHDLQKKIKTIVELRGHLRHHSLKSPKRWDPNRQIEFREAAHFLGVVVGNIVISESISSIYSKRALEAFKKISQQSGNETEIRVQCHRLAKKPWLSLQLSYPTTVVSSKLCTTAIRTSLDRCERDGQIDDTVHLLATAEKTNLELFAADLGVWAFTEQATIALKQGGPNRMTCEFERWQSGRVRQDSFDVALEISELGIRAAWKMLLFVLARIEERDPTTRVMRLKLLLNDRKIPFLNYRVGAQVRN